MEKKYFIAGFLIGVLIVVFGYFTISNLQSEEPDLICSEYDKLHISCNKQRENKTRFICEVFSGFCVTELGRVKRYSNEEEYGLLSLMIFILREREKP